MRIRKNENFVIFCILLFILFMIFIISLICFLGWSVNKELLIIYFTLIAAVFLISALSYLIYIIFCKSFIIFSNTSIIEVKNNAEKKIIEYKDIGYSKYTSIIDNFFYIEGGGYLLIYPNHREKTDPIVINISKRRLKKISNKLKINQ